MASEAVYLVGMNVFLSTPLFEKAIDGTPLVVDIHYTRGWSFFPTRIHAKGLSIRGTDSHVEWILRLDDVEFDCSLLALARQHFHVSRARGSGISFRARLKVASPEATDDLVGSLPPIDSLGPVGFIPSVPPAPETWDDKQWHLWTIQIDDVLAEQVREVWIEQGHFQGDARVTGGFFLKPIRAASVGPAHVDIRSGTVEVDSRTVASPLVASIDFELSKFDPRRSENSDVIPHISLSLDAATTIPDLDHLGLNLPDSGQAFGRLEVPKLVLRIAKGELRDGTRLEAHAEDARLTTAAHVVSAGVNVTADVTGGTLSGRAELINADGDFALTVPNASVVVDSKALSLVDPFTDLHGVMDVKEARLLDATRLADLLPQSVPFRIDHGTLTGSLHGEAWRPDKRVRGSLGVRATDAIVTAGHVRGGGDAEIDASVGSLQFDPLRASDVHAAVTVSGAHGGRRESPAEDIVRVSKLVAKADATLVDADQPFESLRASVESPEIEVFDRDSAREALGLGSSVRLATRQARFEASANVVLDGPRGKGDFQVRAPGLAVTYPGRRIDLDLDLKGRAHSNDWKSASLSVDTAALIATHLVVRDLIGDPDSGPAVSVARVAIEATSSKLSLSDPFARGSLIGSIDEGHMISTTALGDLLPAGTVSLASKEGATFSGDVALQVEDHIAHGAASLTAYGLGVAGPKIRVAGDTKVVADVARWDSRRKTLGGSIAMTIRNAAGGFDEHPGPPDFSADRIEGRVSATSFDLASPSMTGVDYGLRIGHAKLVDARAFNAFLPAPAILSVESGHAVLSADIATSGATREAGGRIDLAITDGGIRLHDTHLAGNFGLAVRAHGFDPEKSAIDLEGSRVQMRNVRVTGATTDTAAWNGDLVLQSGSLALSPAPKLEGDLTLEARDASPLLAILFRDSLPKFVAALVQMPKLTAVAHLAIEPQSFIVSDLFVNGGDISLRGTYVLRHSQLDAAFVVQKGPWSAGLRLDDQGSHVRLFGLDRWYGHQSRAALAPRHP